MATEPKEISVSQKINEEAEMYDTLFTKVVAERGFIHAAFKSGAYKAIEIITKWTPVTESMPEDHPELLSSDSSDVEHTVKLLVMTDTGSICDNYRLKCVEPKGWDWFMGIEGEEIEKWRILY